MKHFNSCLMGLIHVHWMKPCIMMAINHTHLNMTLFCSADLRKRLGDVWMMLFTGGLRVNHGVLFKSVRFMRKTVPPLHLVNLQTLKTVN